MVWYIRKSIHLIAYIKRRKIAANIACVNGAIYKDLNLDDVTSYEAQIKR